MAKAIFTTKVSSDYDDLPEIRYHFPKTYLNQARDAIGDWIIYYEPRRVEARGETIGGRQSYFATARVKDVVPDPSRSDHFYAYVEDYLDFDIDVPFREADFYYESILKKEDGSTNKGAFGRSVRIIPEHEYELIMQAAYAPILHEERTEASPVSYGLSDQGQEEFQRPIVESIVKRPFRDAAFSRLVKTAYDQTCSMTGLKIINGGGRSEVQAAHIIPVADHGPDTVRNGLALCGTVHWMFDRGLLSIDDDMTILKAKGKIPEPVDRMLNASGKLDIPRLNSYVPHPNYLKYHRDNIFKG